MIVALVIFKFLMMKIIKITILFNLEDISLSFYVLTSTNFIYFEDSRICFMQVKLIKRIINLLFINLFMKCSLSYFIFQFKYLVNYLVIVVLNQFILLMKQI